MSLNADQGMGLEPFEVEVTRVAANRMERRYLLHEGVLDTSQDEVYCLAGFTYAQQIAEQVSKAKGKKTFEEMVPEYYSVTFGLHSITQIHRTASFPIFSFSLHRSPCTIRSCGSCLYDTILSIIRCTISISEPHILRYSVLGEFRSLST